MTTKSLLKKVASWCCAYDDLRQTFTYHVTSYTFFVGPYKQTVQSKIIWTKTNWPTKKCSNIVKVAIANIRVAQLFRMTNLLIFTVGTRILAPISLFPCILMGLRGNSTARSASRKCHRFFFKHLSKRSRFLFYYMLSSDFY